jgi:hypothetical protein
MQTKGDNNSKLEGRKIEFRLELPRDTICDGLLRFEVRQRLFLPNEENTKGGTQ